MTLDYIALAILIAVVLILFYGIIVIHDIPYEIAKKKPSAPGCYSLCRLGQPVYASRAVAAAVDLGDAVARGPRLGNAEGAAGK